MDVPLYDVYLTGKLADDVTPEIAAQRLAALFKTTPAAMAGLLTGKAQLLKRGVDKNTALKYRDALQKAGCETLFKAQTLAPAALADDAPAHPTHAASPSQPASNVRDHSSPVAPIASGEAAVPGLNLAPAGADLLRADERHAVTAPSIDTAHLSLAPAGPLPETAQPTAVAPDTSHLSIAAAGADLLAESERTLPPAIEPDISGLSVAEVGAPIETLKDEQEPLHPDTSGFSLAATGSDLLTESERRRPQPLPPATDHLTLAPEPIAPQANR